MQESRCGLAALLLLPLALSCSNAKTKTPEPSSEASASGNVQAPKAPAVPTTHPVLVALAPPSDEPTDCTAAGPESGVFDRQSPGYLRIEYSEGKQTIRETAYLANDIKVVANTGGCAHTGVSYQITFPDDYVEANKAADVIRALDLLDGLATVKGATSHIDELSKNLRPLVSDPAQLEDCLLSVDIMLSMGCDTQATDEGKTQVSLAYDIAL